MGSATPSCVGSLAPCYSAWKDMGAGPAALSVIRRGIRWQFLRRPTLANEPVPFAVPRQEPRRSELFRQVQELLNKGAVEPVERKFSPGFYSNLFLVEKASGGFRPVINLEPLNRGMVVPKFKMETIASVIKSVKTGDWAVSIDLKDAYFHVAVHRSFQKYLRFALSRDEVYQFRVLPFGLSTAPREFTLLTREVAQYLHTRCIRIHMYLDDWLIRHPDHQVLISQLEETLDLTGRLGFRLNLPKSELVPSQDFVFLGVRFNTVNGLVYPTDVRVERLWEWIRRIRRAKRVPARIFLVLLGHLTSLAAYVPLGRLHTRPLQFHLLHQWRPQEDSLCAQIDLDDSVRDELDWWSSPGHVKAGVCLDPPTPDLTICTDASLSGWGAVLTGEGDLREEALGTWPDHYRGRSINSLELEAVALALEAFRRWTDGKAVHLLSDNTTVVSYITKQGGTHSAFLTSLTRRILTRAASRGTTLSIAHIPGKRNVLADALSRSKPILTEWELDQEIFPSLLDQSALSPTVDLMATRSNAKLPVFVSPFPDPRALSVDALSMDWSHLLCAYVFPPTAVVRDVLEKIRTSTGMFLAILPMWPNQSWYPDLLALCVDHPIELPTSGRVLSQIVRGTEVLHPNLRIMHLHAWTLSSNTCLRSAFLRRLQSSPPDRSEIPRRGSTTSGGRLGAIGVLEQGWIRSIPLKRS